jgi:hypothetical protein
MFIQLSQLVHLPFHLRRQSGNLSRKRNAQPLSDLITDSAAMSAVYFNVPVPHDGVPICSDLHKNQAGAGEHVSRH